MSAAFLSLATISGYASIVSFGLEVLGEYANRATARTTLKKEIAAHEKFNYGNPLESYISQFLADLISEKGNKGTVDGVISGEYKKFRSDYFSVDYHEDSYFTPLLEEKHIALLTSTVTSLYNGSIKKDQLQSEEFLHNLGNSLCAKEPFCDKGDAFIESFIAHIVRYVLVRLRLELGISGSILVQSLEKQNADIKLVVAKLDELKQEDRNLIALRKNAETTGDKYSNDLKTKMFCYLYYYLCHNERARIFLDELFSIHYPNTSKPFCDYVNDFVSQKIGMDALQNLFIRTARACIEKHKNIKESIGDSKNEIGMLIWIVAVCRDCFSNVDYANSKHCSINGTDVFKYNYKNKMELDACLSPFENKKLAEDLLDSTYLENQPDGGMKSKNAWIAGIVNLLNEEGSDYTEEVLDKYFQTDMSERDRNDVMETIEDVQDVLARWKRLFSPSIRVVCVFEPEDYVENIGKDLLDIFPHLVLAVKSDNGADSRLNNVRKWRQAHKNVTMSFGRGKKN